ncbi:DUF29 domain-containing protein [Acidisoma sp.]|uniref:DUF29 domain-containing protein n=1 Tax=Acidisoma sp. TaxID=1872115 RepID=UPI003B005411
MSDLYERDFFAWANEQAELLRSGKLSDADIINIAEEIDSMGRSEKRELVSRLTILLLHLLKWQFQPTHRGASWEASVANARDHVADHLTDNPSLRVRLPEATASAYRYALREASAETGIRASAFPATCPYSFDEMMDEGFWPGD